MLKAIHAQESKAAALAKAIDVVAALKDLKLKETAKKVEDSVEETLTYMAFPFEHWTRIHGKPPFSEPLLKDVLIMLSESS